MKKRAKKKPSEPRKSLRTLQVIDHQWLKTCRADYLARAIAALDEPAPSPVTVRPEREGDVVAQFILPLELCRTTNHTRHEKVWHLIEMRARAAMLMKFQYPSHIDAGADPLPGRPQILCVRFSAKTPDKYSDWAKNPIDRLLCPRRAVRDTSTFLGLVRDDNPEAADVHQWSEPAKNGDGFVYIEVRTGKAAA